MVVRKCANENLNKLSREKAHTGTKELRKFLREKSIPRPILTVLMPEELKKVSDSDLDIIIQRVYIVSSSSLEYQKEAPSPPRSTSPLTSHVSGEESFGQPEDS